MEFCVLKNYPHIKWNFEHQKPLKHYANEIMPSIYDGWFLTMAKSNTKIVYDKEEDVLFLSKGRKVTASIEEPNKKSV